MDPGAFFSGVFIFDDHKTGERLDGELPQDRDLVTEALTRITVG